MRYVVQALKDPKLYVMVLIYLGTNCSLYAISFFLPSIIAGLGYTNAQYSPEPNTESGIMLRSLGHNC